MTDNPVAKRIRSYAQWPVSYTPEIVQKVLIDAADEIERLEREIQCRDRWKSEAIDLLESLVASLEFEHQDIEYKVLHVDNETFDDVQVFLKESVAATRPDDHNDPET